MKRLTRWYGAHPLHLLALLGCFALAGYAAVQLVSSRPATVAVWFLGAVVGHDLVLLPLYSLADKSALAAFRRRAPRSPAAPWINYLRVPAGLSGLLLLIWFPLILRLHTDYHASTTLSADPFLWHWLGVTGALFLGSAVLLALRLRRMPGPAASHPAPSRGENDRDDPAGAARPGPARATDQGPDSPGRNPPAPVASPADQPADQADPPAAGGPIAGAPPSDPA